ncbi:MAG: extracellular solute-binding protein [Eubacteriales bacterium]|nr:extracellular solute-binding protein [Eubacteriales bacterium]
MKKFFALLLALTMVLSLAACGSKPAEPTAAPTEAPAVDAPATEAPATEAPAPAELEPVTLKMWFHGSTVTPEASAKVMETLNPILQEKLNVTLEPIWGTWGDFDTSVTTALAGGDDVDIYFTCNWSGNEYNSYARDGYYVKLDDLLDTCAPELKAAIPEGIWDCAKTNGAEGMGIYAVPGLKDTATQNCWDVNGTLLAECGYNVDEVCAAGLDYFSAEFEEMLAAAKAKKGNDFYPLLIEPAVLERMVTHSAIVTGDLSGANVLSYYYDAEHPATDLGNAIVNKYGTDEFAAFAAKTYEYAQKGYISPSCQNPNTANDYRTACQSSGEYLFGTQSYAFGCELDFSNARGIDVRMVPETAAYMDCTSGQGAMMAISATSKNPERALMFLNLLNTDSEIMTLVNYGVEGYTYNKNDDGTITFVDEVRATYSPWTNGVGNVRILPPTAQQGTDFWTRFADYYNAAETLPYGGFVFDNSVCATESAAIANVYAEYAFNLMSGAVNPDEVLPEFLEKLNEAGMETLVNAANEQMTAYLAG